MFRVHRLALIVIVGRKSASQLTPSVALGLMLIATGTIAGSLAVAGG
jgi:hypothetical protein